MAARKKKKSEPRPGVEPGYLSVVEAAKVIGIDESQVRRQCRAGNIPCVQITERVRLIKPEDAAAFAKTVRKPGRKPAKK